MRLLIKSLVLYALYIKVKIKYRRSIKFNGFTVFFAHKGSDILIDKKGGIVINSNPYSNLAGISQRTIISCRSGGIIKIGNGVGISGSTIYAINSITIGKNTLIGSNCKIVDNDFHPLAPSKRLDNRDQDIKNSPILIGANCFIGMNSIILKGTTLGNNCIIGAGSVVHGNIPDNAVVAGNPAKIIKYMK